MAGEDVPAPALGYRFDLRVDEVSLGLFTKIDGLSAEYETKEIKEGGENHFVHVLRGRLKFARIKLTRPVDANSGVLASWFTHADSLLNPQRSTASIAAYDGSGREVARWNFVGVYPTKYTGPSFAAGSTTVLSESLELAHNGFVTGNGNGRANTGGGGGGARAARTPGPPVAY